MPPKLKGKVERTSDIVEGYKHIARTFAFGVVRLFSARVASKTAEIVLLRCHSSHVPETDLPPNANYLLSKLMEVSSKEYECFAYVSEASMLVYGTTLFDTFLSQTTTFLFTVDPSKLGEECKIPIGTLLSSKRSEILNKEIEKRVRKVSFLSFSDRVDFLSRRFDLALSIDRKDRDALDRYAELRNQIVHDQSIFEVLFDKRGKLTVQKRSCPVHPTHLKNDDFSNAVSTYRLVAAAIAQSVGRKILQVSDPVFENLLPETPKL